MIDRTLVTSGFDSETVVSERYLSYLLLAQVEAGFLPLEFAVVRPGIDVTVRLHPPADEDYQRLYSPDPGAPLPAPLAESFSAELFPGEASPVSSIAFSPDGSRLVAGSWDGLIRVWDVPTRRDLLVWSAHPTAVSSLVLSPDGTRIASASVDGTVGLWDAATGNLVSMFTEHAGPVFAVAFSPDGARIASGGSDRIVRVRDAATGAPLSALPGHSAPILAVRFSPDGARIASGAGESTVRLWDPAANAPVATFTGHAGSVTSLAFHPAGARLASGSFDRTIRVWDVAAGTTVSTLAGHTGEVTGVAYSPNGARIASASRDRTVRVWSAATGALQRTLEGHRRSALCVAFTPDGSGVASGSEDAKVRMWVAATGAPQRSFMLVFMRLSILTTVVDNATGNDLGTLNAGLLVDFALEADETSDGLERNHALRLSLVRLDDATAGLLQAAGIDPDVVADAVREQLDRRFPLGVAQGQEVQRIRVRKLVDGMRRSMGFYVDLALRTGPEPGTYHAPRGNPALARDFREDDVPIAFATSPGLFALLGPDAKFRRAEERPPGSGSYRYPLREDPSDPESDEIGRIKGISIGPEMISSGSLPPVPTGRLMIDVHGEYTDAPGDPDFHLQLLFRPKIDDGLVQWDPDVDVDLGLLATLVLIAGGIGLTLLFGPALGWGSTLIVGTLVGLAVLKGLIAEPLAAKLIEGRMDESQQASFLDALPFRVPAATRRWDPFYVTAHQVVGLVDAVTVDQLGIAFEGTDLRLGKQPTPIGHSVIRDEDRSAEGGVAALRYRISDFAAHQADFQAIAPAVDRMDFTRTDPQGEPTLVSLTDDQIAARIGDDPGERRILAPLTYIARRIHLVEGQIDQLLCVSAIERDEEQRRVTDRLRAAVDAEVRANEGAAIREEVTAELEQELGRPPTAEEIEEAFNRRIGVRVQEVFDERFPGELDDAIARVLRFDLAPEELVARQRAGVVVLDGKVIIVRKNADGTVTPYYRDRADGNPADNLLALPHYTPPYQPPP